jgi:endonuclease/exonuclease/phosphatase (EEP) superfamily protein YafD
MLSGIMRALRLALDLVLWPPVLMFATLCAAASIAAQWGRVSLSWDVAAQFAPLWLAGSAISLVTAALFRRALRWSVVVVSLVGLAFGASLVLPEFLRPAGPQAPKHAPEQLKIVQFNVWHDNPDPKAVLDWLDSERPDIAVIEENSLAFSRAVAARSGWEVACRRCEVVVLSRTPAVSVTDGRGEHPHTPLTRAVFRDRRGLFEVIGVHNAWPTDADQPFQERRLAETIRTAETARLIVTGDFNSTPWSFARRRWDAAFGIPRRDRAVSSWPARSYKRLKWLGVAFLPIDHVYAGPGWATVSVQRGPKLSSDHYPLIVTLAPVSPR